MFSLSLHKFHSTLLIPALFPMLMLFDLRQSDNHPPVAGDDAYTVHGCKLMHVTDNDYDSDNDPISVNGFPTMPAHGSLSNNGSGNVFYCANTAYVGSDSFVYQLCDPQNACATATVTLDVQNQPPTGGTDSFNIHGFTVITGLLANDSDSDGDGITCGGAGHDCIQSFPQHGTLSLVGQDRYTFSPEYAYTGSDGFTYNVCDNLGLCALTTVNLSVNNNTPIAGDDQYKIPGAAFTRIGPLRGNDSDPDQDTISEPNLLTFPQHGSLFGVSADIKTYNPDPGFYGTDGFTYRICDSLGKCATATVTLYVIGDGENDGPCDSCNGAVGSPINVSNGNMYLQQGDYQLPSVGAGLSLTRTYNSDSQRIGLFGRGWSTAYDESVVAYDNNLIRFDHAGGRAVYFGRPVGSSNAFTELIGDLHEQVTQGGSGFTLTMKNGSSEQFNSAGKLLSMTDRNGNTASLTYGGNGYLASVTDPFGRVLTVNTNVNGQVTSISDSLGTVATYTYGGSSELLSVTFADNSAFNFAYDGSLRLTSVTDALGNIVESHTYDGQGRAITSEKQGGVDHYSLSYVSANQTDVTDGLGRITKYTFDTSKGRNVVTRVEGLCSCGGANSQVQTWTYDSQLKVTSKTDALNHVRSYTYDSNGNRLTETDPTGTVTYTYNGFAEVLTRTDQMNFVTTNTYDATGNLQSTTDALNNATTFTYNARGQMLTATDARGKVTTFTYDASGNLTRRTDANSIITFFFYDARSRLTKVCDGLSRSTLFGYDAFGRINKVTHPDLSFISFTYDLAGRRTIVTDERNNATNYGYDAAYRLTSVTDALSHATSYGYDSMSNLTSVTDALSRTTTYDYDEFNRLVKITYPPATAGATRLFESMAYDGAGNVTSRIDTAGRVTGYAYDSANRITGTTDAANQTTTFAYDALSRVTSLTDAINQHYVFGYDALGRQTSITRAGSSMSYVYDEVGNRTQRTDYNGVVTKYAYDNLNRLSTITYPSRTVTYGYDPLNNVTRATNENGTVYISYDNRYRVSSFSDPFFYGISYNYDTVGNRTKLKVNGATYATYTYDSVNRIKNLADSANLNFTYSYDGVNRLISRSAPNGVTSSYGYDDLDRLTSLMHTAGATTLSGNLYTYNNANNISSWTTQTTQKAFSYDTVDQLTGVSNYETPVESYSYDAVGNRTASHLSATYGYSSFNRLTSTANASYSYDNNGSLISKTDASGATAYTFNEENQLTQVTLPSGLTLNYKYDALGRRIQRTTSAGANERYVYDGADALIDLNADWSVATTYFNDLGIDNHLRQSSTNAGVFYFLADHLGSTSGLTDTVGNVIEQLNYDSFGNTAPSARTRYTYTGRERDPDTGQFYYRARFYDPNLGRFMSEDPIGFAGGINQFAYVNNNSQTAKDPFGLYETDVHYYLTYYLATQTGCFSPSEARAIAHGDQYVDENPDTRPGFGGDTPVMDPRPNYRQQQANIDYHALHAGSHQPYLEMHWRRAMANGGDLGGLGIYLHYLQDTFSHRGFVDPLYGHSPAHGGNHADDKTDEDVDKAMEMAMATFEALIRFAKQTGRLCKCGPVPDWGKVRRFAEAPGGNAITRRAYDIDHVNPSYLRNKVNILDVPWR